MGENRQRLIDTLFLVGVVFKGLDGAVELLLGIPLLVLSPRLILAITQASTAGELRADPNDLLANFMLHEASGLSHGATVLGAAYLLLHGGVKLAIVVALLRGSRRVYPWAIAALAVFLAFQIGQFAFSPSVGVIVLCLFDAVILWLTWREWRHGRTLHDVWRSVVRGWFPPRLRAMLRRTRLRIVEPIIVVREVIRGR
jgi:uncharacterized membrane protein